MSDTVPRNVPTFVPAQNTDSRATCNISTNCPRYLKCHPDVNESSRSTSEDSFSYYQQLNLNYSSWEKIIDLSGDTSHCATVACGESTELFIN